MTGCLFLQASAYRPTTESVVDENGHVVGKLSSKEGLANSEGMAVRQDLLFTVAVQKNTIRGIDPTLPPLPRLKLGLPAVRLCVIIVRCRLYTAECRMGLPAL